MIHRNSVGIFAAILVCFLLTAMIAGCTGREEPAETGPDQAITGSEDSSETTPEEVEGSGVVRPDSAGGSSSESADEVGEVIGINPDELTQEEASSLTGFGAYMFPGSEYVVGGTSAPHQTNEDGTEIYNLKFGTETNISSVGDWYSDNLESGFESQIFEPTGSTRRMVFYDTQEANRGYIKSITLEEAPGGTVITVSVAKFSPHQESE